jgi:hypothetical protein
MENNGLIRRTFETLLTNGLFKNGGMDMKKQYFLISLFLLFLLIPNLVLAGNADLSQALADRLIYEGYSFIDIQKASEVAYEFNSFTEDVLKFRPRQLNWDEYKDILITYYQCSYLMKACDNLSLKATFSKNRLLKNIAMDKIKAKQDVLDIYYGKNKTLVKALRGHSFSEEEILGVAIICNLDQVDPEAMADSFTYGDSTDNVAKIIQKMQKVIGL